MVFWLRQTVLGLILCVLAPTWSAKACGKQGFCDLTDSSLSWDQDIAMNGEWAFYWKQLLSPDAIRAGQGEVTTFFAPDDDWRGAKLDSWNLHSVPFGTYHLEFAVSGKEPLTIRFPRLPSAVRIWVNSDLVASLGELSEKGPEKSARMQQIHHTFVPQPGKNSITIEISNFSYYFHSGSGGVVIGRPEVVHGEFESTVIRDALTFGAILIMAFYHFYLWWIRRSRLSPLLFGIFCFAMGLRSLVVGQGQMLTIWFPNAALELQLKIEYLSIAIPAFALVFLVHDLYPKEYPRKAAYPFAGLALLWVLIIVASTADVFPQTLRAYQFLLLVAGTTIIGSLTLAAIRRSEGAVIFLLGFGSIFGASVIDILVTMGVLKFPPMAHVGTFAMVFFQAILLSRRFDKAFDQAEQAEKEVRTLNEGLERMVKERTDQINTILRNVSSGFLLIDRQGILQPGFTESCHKLIGVNLTAGKRLSDMLPIDAKMKSMLRETIIQVFDDFMPTDVSLAQIPHPVPIGDRMLGISGAALRDESNHIWAILFTITDVTRLQEAEKQIRYNEMLIGILREQAAFRVFLEDFRREVQQAAAAIQANNQAAARNLLHTMKGNLGIFGMRQLADFIHNVEGHESIQAEDVQTLSRLMESLLEDNKSLLGLDRRDVIFELRRSDYEAIVAWSAQHLEARHHQELLAILRRSSQNTIRSYVGPLQNTVELLGQKLYKKVVCELTGADILVDERYSSVLRNLVHLVRNAVDHGIEYPEERGVKSKTGTIKVSFTKTDANLVILVEDDGRGLNADVIRDRAVRLGLIQGQGENMTEEQIHRLIFAQGFSTAEELSDVSGRGVGMSAILEAVEELSGTVQIRSERGKGLAVLIEVPLVSDRAARLDLAV